MKKVSYLIISLFMIFAFYQNAYAGGYDVGNTFPKSSKQMKGNIVGPSGKAYWQHIIKTDTGGSRLAACMDPGICEGGNEVKIERVLFSGTESRTNAYDAGIAIILSHVVNSEDYDQEEAALERVARQAGARIFTMFWPDFERNNIQNDGQYQELIPIYNSLIDNDNYYALIKKATKTTKTRKELKKKCNGKCPSGKWTIDGKDVSATLKKKLKDYVIEGFETAASVRENNNLPTVTIGDTTRTTKIEGNYFTRTITRNIEVANFNSSIASAKLYVDCPNCQSNNITMNLYINDQKINNGQQLIGKYTKNGSGKVKLKIEFKTPATDVCIETDYTTRVEYQDAKSFEAYQAKPTSDSNCQNFIFVNSKTDTKKKTNKLVICSNDCETIKALCENGNQNACEKLKKDFGGDCAECTTKINNVECTDKDSTINLKEGVAIDGTTCNAKNEQKNVKECILNNRDIAGNSYQAKTEGYPNNNYCKVYCTEDYDIDVPGIQSTNSGRYIKLSANVSGTKSCYTTEINRTQFEKDLANRQQELIEAYKVFLRWKGAKDVLDSSGVSSETFPANSVCGGTYTNYFVKFTFDELNSYNIDQTGQLTKFAVASNTGSDEVRSNGSPGTSSCCYGVTGEKDGKPTYGCNCSRYCSSQPRDGSSTTVRNTITSSYNSAVRALETALSNLNKIIKEYNSCSGNILQGTNYKSANSTLWHMKYNFAPKVSFWYEDNHMELAKSIYLIGTSNLGSLNIENCNSSVDSYYNICDSSWIKNNSTSSAKNLLSCYKSGKHYICSSSAYNIADAKYVKQTQTASASYILPTQFYTVFPSGKIISEPKEGTSPLENALPISLGTQAGVYNYTLNVKDLGEYYDSGKSGRIWGSEKSVVVTALEDENSCSYKLSTSNLPNNKPAVSGDDKGKYTCSYKVNCPGCKVTCGPNGCIWADCEDGHCVVKCDKCIFSNGETNFTYRPITTKDINPNNRELGANWKYDENSINTTTELKAYATTNDILTKGEKVYEEGSDDIVMKVKLTQTMIRDIKKYNAENDDNGGYASNSLKCYNYKDSDGVIYENIYCYSTFIDEMANKYSNNIKFTKDRVMASSASDNDSKRKSLESKNQCESGTNCYWTTWTDALKDSNFRVSTKIEKFDYTKFVNNYKDGVGPSYR